MSKNTRHSEPVRTLAWESRKQKETPKTTGLPRPDGPRNDGGGRRLVLLYWLIGYPHLIGGGNAARPTTAAPLARWDQLSSIAVKTKADHKIPPNGSCRRRCR